MKPQQTLTPEQMVKIRQHFRYHPDWFFKNWLGITLYDKQVEICESIIHNRVTSVASCNAAGKTGTAGGVVPWYLLSWDDSIVVTTAPKWQQVKDLLWREINTRWERAKYPLSSDRPNVVSWQLASNWYAVGVASKDPTKVQGYHADSGHLLVVVDEAAGVDEPIFEGIHALLTSRDCRLLMLGNPTSVSGEFRDSFKPASLANRIRISAFDTPNFKANNLRNEEDVIEAIESKRELAEPYPSLISPDWVYEKIKKWRPGSPMYQARVLAQFPEVGENNLIPLNLIEAACTDERLEKVLGVRLNQLDPMKASREDFDANELQNNKLRQAALELYIADQNTHRGVDVARFGSDSTVIQPRWGKVAGYAQAFHKEDTMQTAGRVWPMIRNLPTDVTAVDVIGVGGGVVDRLHELQREQEAMGHGQWAQVLGVDVASAAETVPEGLAQMRFANQRAELYWQLAERFEAGDIYLMPDDNGNPPEELMDELSSIQYEFRGDKIYIEEKKEMKKRLLKSPDRADALMLSFARETSDGSGWFNEASTEDPVDEPEDPDYEWEPQKPEMGDGGILVGSDNDY